MTIDWKVEISRIVHWKQLAASYDKQRLLPWYLPRVGATPEKIAMAEQMFGTKFPQLFEDFLGFADGWQGFYILIDLFGTKEFLDGKSKLVLERPEIKEFLDVNHLHASEVIPIGASDFDIDVFLCFSHDSKFLPEGVLWFANDEIDRFNSFAEFLSAMVNYNAKIAQKMAKE